MAVAFLFVIFVLIILVVLDDSCYEKRDLEAREEKLRFGRQTIVTRLTVLATAMETLNMRGASDIREAIEHLERSE